MGTIQKVISKISIENMVKNQQILAQCNPELSKADKKYLKKTILKGKNLKELYGALILYAYYLRDEGVKELRKEGFFGYWKHDSDTIKVEQASAALLNNKELINLSDNTIKYLQKKQKNAWLGQCFCKIRIEIDEIIKRHHEARKKMPYNNEMIETSLLRELISYLDFTFLTIDKTTPADDTNLDDLDSYQNEEKASAVSFIIYRYDSIIGIKNINPMNFMDADYVLSEEIKSLILLACKLLRLREWEFYWDRYEYDFSDEYCFYAPNETLDKSIKLGYINTQIQEMLFFSKTPREEFKNLSEYFKVLEKNKKITSWLTSKTGTGFFERYTLKNIPEILKIIRGNNAESSRFYFEEFAMLDYMAKELVVPFTKLLERKFAEDITIKDAVIFQRIFVMNRMLYQYIFNQEYNKKALIRSMGQIITTNVMETLINTQINDINKTRKLLKFYTYQGKRYDIQYTPFIKIGDYYCCPTNICAVSNFIRNSIAYSYEIGEKSLSLEKTGDDLEDLCANAFKRYSEIFRVEKGKNYTYKGRKGEMDIFVVSDDMLLFIECKNPILPTNAFSMRTSFDYIEKATKQLNNEMKAFSDIDFQKQYLESSNIPYKKRKLYSCIVMGNRLFSGYTGVGHPIRYIHDLVTFLESGKINLFSQNKFTVKSIWNNDQFRVEDLQSYLSDNNYPSKKYQMDAMIPYIKKMTCGNHIVKFKTYKMGISNDLEKSVDDTNIKTRFLIMRQVFRETLVDIFSLLATMKKFL